ncbi:hypothetical protein GCK32_005195 [Trichostrongylus colubriformis]|uniref:Uncharacterized protein n=1 Tax=Trichostrongylus colubriformis TaxID=6319 RepID=A0AAN8IMK4_TRICO
MKLFMVMCLLAQAQSYQRNEANWEEFRVTKKAADEKELEIPEEEGVEEAIDKNDRLDDLVRLMFGYPLEYLRHYSGDDVWNPESNIVVAQYYYHRNGTFYQQLEGLYGSFHNIIENFAKNLLSREDAKKELIGMWNHINEGTQNQLKEAFFGYELIDDMAKDRRRSHNEYVKYK